MPCSGLRYRTWSICLPAVLLCRLHTENVFWKPLCVLKAEPRENNLIFQKLEKTQGQGLQVSSAFPFLCAHLEKGACLASPHFWVEIKKKKVAHNLDSLEGHINMDVCSSDHMMEEKSTLDSIIMWRLEVLRSVIVRKGNLLNLPSFLPHKSVLLTCLHQKTSHQHSWTRAGQEVRRFFLSPSQGPRQSSSLTASSDFQATAVSSPTAVSIILKTLRCDLENESLPPNTSLLYTELRIGELVWLLP